MKDLGNGGLGRVAELIAAVEGLRDAERDAGRWCTDESDGTNIGDRQMEINTILEWMAR